MDTNSSATTQVEQLPRYDGVGLDDCVIIDQMRMFCSQKQILVAMSVTVLCLVFFLWRVASPGQLCLLLILSAVVTLKRFHAIRAFPKLTQRDIDLRIWHRRFVMLAALSGGVFVALEVVGYRALHNGHWGLFDIAVVSACGAALGSMALVPGLYPWFALPPLVVMAAFHAAAGGFYNLFVVLGTLVVSGAYLATAKNVTRTVGTSLRLRIQNELLTETTRQQHQHLAVVLDNLPEATFVIDRNGVVTAWNRAAEQLTGVKADDIVGKGDHEYAVAFYGERRPILIDLVFLPEHELLRQRYSHVRRVGDRLFAETSVAMPSGRDTWLQGSAAGLRDANGTIVGAIETVLDLTERKQFEDDLAAAREAAERASQAKAVFLANVSHELRTPMNAIIGMTHLVLQTELTPRQQGYLQKIHRAARHLAGIIAEILDFSGGETGALIGGQQQPVDIDTDAGLAGTMHDPALYRKMLCRFRESHAGFAVQFTTARGAADPLAATRTAHSLKGAAGIIGAKGVQQAADALEQACRHQAGAATIDRLLARTEEALTAAFACLEGGESPATGGRGARDHRSLSTLLNRLRALLEQNNLEAGEVADELVAATNGTPLAEPVRQLAKAVAAFEVDAALEALQQVAALLERS